ncbi:MAG: Flp pilus assembly complex ATPase component TadA [Candidatus Omnitrophica bacterium]|nr:Flp pilus assembly complex ATPase component TadA [Candidatus Omnitrophota bacterium]
MNKLDSLLYDELINSGHASKDALNDALKESEAQNESLAVVLVKKNIAKQEYILKVFSRLLSLRFMDLKNCNIDKQVLDKVPVKFASYYQFVPLEIKDRVMVIAVAYPLETKTQDEIRMQLGYDLEVVLATREDILEALRKYYGLAADTLRMIVSSVNQETTVFEDRGEKIEDIEKLAGDASIIKLVNQIILEAYRKRATDIHIEPYRQDVAVRYRIDGILYDANIPGEIRNFLNAIISRIKIMSNLNIVEHRLPQDGRAVVKVQEHVLDLRISTIPTSFGESVVIRILPTQMLFNLEKLGLSKREVNIFEDMIKKPHGIIFVTGPTGSGKTTTLYTCLNRINTRDRKIITIEDPIEYEMFGITQIQVMPEIGLDFGRGLRSILRHDPDVIMVGEVRDLETAEIAIRVALTGHLVFSTLHTNDAPSAITRLIDIGVEPYLIASSVEVFIAQRLVRLICPECKYEDKSISVEVREMIARDLGLKSLDEAKIFRSKGCINCNFSGFFGRSAIYEILLVDEEVKDLIIKKAPSNRLKSLAQAKGMQTLRQDGWRRVIQGLTTPEEVIRVTSIENLKDQEPLVAYNQEPETMQGENNKRIYNRLDEKINLRYRIFKSAEELASKGYTPQQLGATKNISAGGLVFSSTQMLAISTFVEVRIELPNSEEPVECLSRVVRVEELEEGKKYDIAVCFLDITSAQRSRLEKYITKIQSK